MEHSPPSRGPTHLLYLHGFRSSPQSTKARRVHDWLRMHRPDVLWWCPQLPPSPREAMARVEDGIGGWPKSTMAVIGSSLGGFYATVVMRRHGCPGVLLNPAVDPARDLAAHVGEQTAFHDPEDRFLFRPEFVDELRALSPPMASAGPQALAVIATGDEVLDWREMAAAHADATLRIVDGSDHALSDFDDHLPHLLRFLHLCD
ncbi:MAG: esterase [Rubrivivax sp.]|jgi:hypothetical protein|nr:esterase [Rubrivivax sp.]